MSTDDIPLFNKNYKVYKGKLFYSKRLKTTPRVVAFDLDETLGSFSDLQILWSSLQEYTDKSVPLNFNKLLDLYPEFLRYGILPILEYLLDKKRTGECSNIYIYTNNQCEVGWVDLISKYFSYALNTKQKIFNRIIAAFKINNQRVELARTTHSKTFSDFIKCTLLPKNTELFFIDNTYYPQMKQSEIYYIQPKSYNHNLSTHDVIERFMLSPLCDNVLTTPTDINILRNFLLGSFIRNDIYYTTNKPELVQLETNIVVAQKIMYHLREFFHLSNLTVRTKKVSHRIGRLTRKNQY